MPHIFNCEIFDFILTFILFQDISGVGPTGVITAPTSGPSLIPQRHTDAPATVEPLGTKPVVANISRAAQEMARLRDSLPALKVDAAVDALGAAAARQWETGSVTSSARADCSLADCVRSFQTFKPTVSSLCVVSEETAHALTSLTNTNAVLGEANDNLVFKVNQCNSVLNSKEDELRQSVRAHGIHDDEWLHPEHTLDKSARSGYSRKAIYKVPITPAPPEVPFATFKGTVNSRRFGSESYPTSPPAWVPGPVRDKYTAEQRALLYRSRHECMFLHGTVKCLHDEILELNSVNRKLLAEHFQPKPPACDVGSLEWFMWRLTPPVLLGVTLCLVVIIYTIFDAWCAEGYRKSCVVKGLMANSSSDFTTATSFWREGAVDPVNIDMVGGDDDTMCEIPLETFECSEP